MLNNSRKNSVLIILLIVVLSINLSLISQEVPQHARDDILQNPEISQLLETLSAHRIYKEQLDNRDFVYSILSGIVQGLDDQHSGVLKQYQYPWHSNSSAIDPTDSGIILGKDDFDRLMVTSVLPGSPAERADIQSGDRILRIGNINTAGVPLWELMPLLSAREGASIPLFIQTYGEEPRKTDVKIHPFQVQSITLKTGRQSFGSWKEEEEGPIAWIQIHSFLGEDTLEEWDRYVEQIKNTPSIKRLIIDLRDNGGGDNSSIRLLGDFFRYSDVLVRFENLLGQKSSPEVITNTTLPRSRLMTYPAIVLINSNTASLAEIAAMSLRDNRSIQIVGERSYGKGTTQTWLNLEDDFAVHLTLGNWYSPNGTSINLSGIVPDTEVIDNPRTGKDEQLNLALELIGEDLF